MSTGARLPFAGYVPPPGAPPAPPPRGPSAGDPGIAIDFEQWGDTIPWPINGEQTLWTTSKRWRACDVYLTLSEALPLGVSFQVIVYAVLPSGQRTMVATGRYGGAPAVATVLPMWVCAARAVAARFEVTLVCGGSITAGKIAVTAVASDEANEPPPWVGVLGLGFNSVSIGPASSVRMGGKYPELVRVSGTLPAAIAAPRYLHIHDAGAGSMAGNQPIISLPLGAGVAAAGGGQFGGQWDVRYRSFKANPVIQVVVSSTDSVSTLVVDCNVMGWGR